MENKQKKDKEVKIKKVNLELDSMYRLLILNHSKPDNPKQVVEGYRSDAIKELIIQNISNPINEFQFGEKDFL